VRFARGLFKCGLGDLAQVIEHLPRKHSPELKPQHSKIMIIIAIII
jgi:hypothetical protein